jgi:ferredoxin--NADP+ reductase
MYKIVSKEEVVPNIHRIEIEAPEIARKILPGNFVIILVDERGERLPFTVSDWSKETITLFFLEVGASTMKLAKKREGDSIYSVVGPLGKATEIKKYGTVVLGGGCYGIGAIYPIARALKEVGNKVITIIEARSDYLIYNEKLLSEVSDEVIVCTTDGSRGERGKVHDVVVTLMREERVDMAYFVGCTFMMKNCSETTKPYGVKTLVALNPIMLDGTGMCGCCRVSVNGETRFACVDGPEFDGHSIDWEELFQRKSAYFEEEILAYCMGG